MKEWQKRVVKEKEELDEKITKLEAYLSSYKVEEADENHRRLLMRQKLIMQEYSNVLRERIKLFK